MESIERGRQQAAPVPGWILLFSGSSSSGKTSLARELLRLLTEPAYLFIADECYPQVPAPARVGHEEKLESGIVIFHRALARWAASGRNIIVDGSLPYGKPALRDACLAELKDFDTRVVAVSCSVTELQRRESNRPDPRPQGWAERQIRDVNDGITVALHIDTTSITPAEAAQQVHDWL